MAAPAATSKDVLYKLLIIGHNSVGKTSLMRKYTMGMFEESTRPTIACDFVLKVMQYHPDAEEVKAGQGPVNVTMQLWDIAGQDHNATLNRNFYQGAYGACVVCDIKRIPTYEKAVEWKKSVDKVVLFPGSAETIPCVLLLNKCDLGKSEWKKDQIDAFCKEHGFAAWFTVSAKDGTNIDKAMEGLVKLVVEKHRSVGPAAPAKKPAGLVKDPPPAAEKKPCPC